jgi:hypothetical protein
MASDEFEEAGAGEVACAGSADAVAAKHRLIAVEQVSSLKLREALVTNTPPFFVRLSGTAPALSRRKPLRRRLSFLDLDLPGFYPAVRPDVVSHPDGISRSSHPFDGPGTLDTHFEIYFANDVPSVERHSLIPEEPVCLGSDGILPWRAMGTNVFPLYRGA